MNRKSVVFWGMAAIACCLVVLAGCSPVSAVPLRVGTVSWIGYEPLYLAQELGFFGQEPIQIQTYVSPTEVNRAYRNQAIDVMASTLDEVLMVRQTESDVYSFLVMDFSDGGDVVLAKPEIKEVGALKGKRIGMEPGALGGYVLSRALQQVGLTLEDVSIVPLGLGEHEAAFRAGRVEAMVTYEPYRTQLLNSGAREIFNSRQIPREIMDVLSTRQSTLSQRSTTLTALVAGWARALNYIAQNPEDAHQRIAKRLGLSPEEVRQSLELVEIPTLAENRALLSPRNGTLRVSVKRLLDLMLAKKLLDRPVVVDDLFSDAIVKTMTPAS